ncbi:ABC transporter permease [Nocardioides sp.]|uniref:ABC transporter permease n=1 Tax=Nocardioides sp. TaxID=35761 RepID=UPI002B2790D1|nr:ABC transporter permease [Nocardioides sp.]
MRSALVAEYRKLRSTRMWWILLLVMAGYLAFLAAVIAFSLNAEGAGTPGVPPASGVQAASIVYSLINSIGYVFPLVVGSLMMTTEFRHGTVSQSWLVEPRRSVFLGAKLVAAVPLGLLYGVVAACAVVAGGAPVLAGIGEGAFLGEQDVVEVLVFGALVIAVWAVIGVAFGAVVTNQVAAIVVIIGFTQLVEPIARIGLGSVDALAPVAAYLPGAAADAVMGASFFVDAGGGELLSRGAGLAVLLAYALALGVLGRATTLRRDLS